MAFPKSSDPFCIGDYDSVRPSFVRLCPVLSTYWISVASFSATARLFRPHLDITLLALDRNILWGSTHIYTRSDTIRCMLNLHVNCYGLSGSSSPSPPDTATTERYGLAHVNVGHLPSAIARWKTRPVWEFSVSPEPTQISVRIVAYYAAQSTVYLPSRKLILRGSFGPSLPGKRKNKQKTTKTDMIQV
ncbi:hypothetical protein ACJQWK_02525 [Exserohilum turcicum]|uniref:Uncharacterized protein n=1 Tax=Exserohilum turcicum (strain 28A) TaxID=671987 RepID=R0KLA7_EXST2|nr:uncharacterized protein SETTUDRAFT_37581 [Exserohilum turcica Et28A]EOA89939.1 hypothetical protein SETTUDRAFT_37581 [Exserohilum turcica Et28A]